MWSENIFKGRFKVLGFYIYVDDEGWVCTKEYDNTFLWTFANGWENDYLNEDNYCGRVVEHYEGTSNIAKYVYLCESMRLFIYRHDYIEEDTNSIVIRIESCYAIQRIDDHEYWLLDLEDENNEGSVRFKLKIKHIW